MTLKDTLGQDREEGSRQPTAKPRRRRQKPKPSRRRRRRRSRPPAAAGDRHRRVQQRRSARRHGPRGRARPRGREADPPRWSISARGGCARSSPGCAPSIPIRRCSSASASIVVANLKPRQMKFGLSEGMILAAGGGDRPHLVATFDATARRAPAGRQGSREPMTRSRSLRASPDRLSAHRRRAHGAVQLAVRAPARRRSTSCASTTPISSATSRRRSRPSSTASAGSASSGTRGPRSAGRTRPTSSRSAAARYQAAVDRLLASGHAYRDYATAEEMDAERKAAEAEKRQFQSSRRCMAETPSRPRALRGRGAQVRSCASRCRARARSCCTTWCAATSSSSGRRRPTTSSSAPTASFIYHLANVVDDHDFDITHVIRAEEHLSNTPRQVFIVQALGYPLPAYAHLPYVAEPGSKRKLSKRKLDAYLKNPDFAKVHQPRHAIAAAMGLQTSRRDLQPGDRRLLRAGRLPARRDRQLPGAARLVARRQDRDRSPARR